MVLPKSTYHHGDTEGREKLRVRRVSDVPINEIPARLRTMPH